MRSAVNWRLLLGATPADVVAAEHARHLLAEPGGMVGAFHTFQLALAVTGGHQALTTLARALIDAGEPDRATHLLQTASTPTSPTAPTMTKCLVAHSEGRGFVRVGELGYGFSDGGWLVDPDVPAGAGPGEEAVFILVD
jgi:predicted Zn-dependent protease